MDGYKFITFMILVSSIFLGQQISSYVVNMMDNYLLHTLCTVVIGFFLTCFGLGSFNYFLEKRNKEDNNEE